MLPNDMALSEIPVDPDHDTVMDKHAVTLYSSIEGSMHVIRTEHNDTQQDAAHQIIQITKASTVRRWFELKWGMGNH